MGKQAGELCFGHTSGTSYHPLPGEFGLQIFCPWYHSTERFTHLSCRGENGLVLAQP